MKVLVIGTLYEPDQRPSAGLHLGRAAPFAPICSGPIGDGLACCQVVEKKCVSLICRKQT